MSSFFKKHKITLCIVLAIIVLALTFFVVFVIGFQRGILAGGLTRSMAKFLMFNENMSAQLANASCEGLKKTLNDYLLNIDEYKNIEGSIFSDTEFYIDKMVTHVRLARIEQKLGKQDEAQYQLGKALEMCNEVGWDECSEMKIIEFSKQLEKKYPIKCLNDD